MGLNTEENSKTARRMCEQGLWQEVLSFAQNWNVQDPGDHKALYYMGLGFSGLNQFTRAETAYRMAAVIDPTDVNIWNNLAGILYERLQRPVEAIACIEQSLKLEPDHKVGWSNLATMVGRLGDHDKAMVYADRALALDPKLVEAYLHKGAAALALGKLDTVREVCDALACIEPENFRPAR